MHSLQSFLHILSFIYGFLHSLQELFFHVKVHILDEVINNIFRFFYLCQIILKFNVFHHISLLENRIRRFHDIFDMLFHILQLPDCQGRFCLFYHGFLYHNFFINCLNFWRDFLLLILKHRYFIIVLFDFFYLSFFVFYLIFTCTFADIALKCIWFFCIFSFLVFYFVDIHEEGLT